MKIIVFIVATFFSLQIASAQKVAVAMKKDFFGYIKDDGTWLIKPQYIKAKSFSNGLASVYNGKKWGFINGNNDLVVDYKFDRVKSFDSGIAVVLKDKKWFYIDKKGVEITNMPFSVKVFDFQNGVAFIRRGEKVGLIDSLGKVLKEPTYAKIMKFRNGYAKVKLGNFWGIIDLKGNEIIETIYQDLGVYSEGVVRAKKDNQLGLIINNEFKVMDVRKIWDFQNGENLTYALNKKKKVGFIDRKGNWIIAPRFKKAKRFVEGLAPVSTDGIFWGYINDKGENVIKENYRDAEVFSKDGLAPVKIKELWGFINKNNEIAIVFHYTIKPKSFNFSRQAFGFKEGLTRVSFKNKWGFLDRQGNLLANTWFQRLENFTDIK